MSLPLPSREAPRFTSPNLRRQRSREEFGKRTTETPKGGGVWIVGVRERQCIYIVFRNIDEGPSRRVQPSSLNFDLGRLDRILGVVGWSIADREDHQMRDPRGILGLENQTRGPILRIIDASFVIAQPEIGIMKDVARNAINHRRRLRRGRIGRALEGAIRPRLRVYSPQHMRGAYPRFARSSL